MDENNNKIELNENEYEEVLYKDIGSLSQIKRNDDIYVICLICGDAVATTPKKPVECQCGNVYHDVTYFRFGAEDLSKCKVVRLLNKKM